MNIVYQNLSDTYIKEQEKNDEYNYLLHHTMKQNNQIKHTGSGYDLEVNLPNENMLSFILKTNIKRQAKLFKNLFAYDDLSLQIKNNFKTASQLYKFLTKRGNFKINFEEGSIIMQVKKLIQNQVLQVGVRLGLKEIVTNLKDRPYQMLAADVQELKMQVFELRNIMNMHNMVLNPQDKEEFFPNEKSQLYKNRDEILQLLKKERKKDVDREYEMISKRMQAEKNQSEKLKQIEVKLESKLKQSNEQIEKLKMKVRKGQTDVANVHKKIDEIVEGKEEAIILEKINQFLQEGEKVQEQPKKEDKKRKQNVKKQEIMEKKENYNNSNKNYVEKALLRKMEIDSTLSEKRLFNLNGNSVSYSGGLGWTQLLLKSEPIPKKYEFNCEICLTRSSNIIVGIVDRTTQKNQRYSWYSGNAICLSGYDGSIHYGNKRGDYTVKENGKGFNQGDTISVQVDAEKGNIKWVVGNKTLAAISTGLLKDKSRSFVPYVEMYDKGDQVRFWQ